ncbi:MAG: MotA/TolQ/ExbB proton channel family protein [Lentisphaerae bacterium]|jgi:biopolymer transport protein ExbB|nr:MotA/TolQ/ExbB proton channel family protein [Lentisphaerota bacterium]MBT5611899.1 MotA/TolQ/ExbB proton channel family protein [Lentisphaerota bacterium]MBT7055504.1 MotA/TolQ/ExbB proton channel family protein [Lentisphaerota bacterium]MBT7847516.1 MotA/TolQ/ExbB proton channel family protein [Lentisphaerota bacterium]
MLERLIMGGPLMVPLMICSVMALTAVFDRCWAFYKYSKVDVRSLRANVLDLLMEDRIEDACVLCASTPGPVAAVLLAGLQSCIKLLGKRRSPETIRMIMGKAMEDFSLHAVSAVEKRFGILSTVASSAPLFGMAGTVTGMIASFSALEKAAALDAALVAGGIKEALVTTAAGLLIALLAVIPLNFFTARADRIVLDIEEASSELLDFVLTQLEDDEEDEDEEEEEA